MYLFITVDELDKAIQIAEKVILEARIEAGEKPVLGDRVSLEIESAAMVLKLLGFEVVESVATMGESATLVDTDDTNLN